MNTKEMLAEYLKNKKFIDLLMELYPDIDLTCQQLFLMCQKKVNSAISVRFSKEDKEAFLDPFIIKIRDNLEQTHAMDIYNEIANISVEGLETKEKMLLGVGQMLGMIPAEHQQTFSTENIDLLRQMATGEDPEKINIKKVEGLINQFGTLVPSLKTASTTENPIETLMKFLIYIHYEIKTLELLCEEKIRANKSYVLKEGIKKIKWLGDQKKLAELFIFLYKSGWIKEISIDLIKSYFTNSDTIHEVLKGDTYDRDGQPLYTKLFTKNYKMAFDLIKPNIKKTK